MLMNTSISGTPNTDNIIFAAVSNHTQRGYPSTSLGCDIQRYALKLTGAAIRSPSSSSKFIDNHSARVRMRYWRAEANGAYQSVALTLSVTKCKFTHIKNVNKTRTFLNFDPVGGRHGGIIFKKTPTQPLKWSVGT